MGKRNWARIVCFVLLTTIICHLMPAIASAPESTKVTVCWNLSNACEGITATVGGEEEYYFENGSTYEFSSNHAQIYISKSDIEYDDDNYEFDGWIITIGNTRFGPVTSATEAEIANVFKNDFSITNEGTNTVTSKRVLLNGDTSSDIRIEVYLKPVDYQMLTVFSSELGYGLQYTPQSNIYEELQEVDPQGSFFLELSVDNKVDFYIEENTFSYDDSAVFLGWRISIGDKSLGPLTSATPEQIASAFEDVYSFTPSEKERNYIQVGSVPLSLCGIVEDDLRIEAVFDAENSSTAHYSPAFLISSEDENHAIIQSLKHIEDIDETSVYEVIVELLTSPYDDNVGNYDLDCYTIGDGEKVPFSFDCNNYFTNVISEKVKGRWETDADGNDYWIIDKDGTAEEYAEVYHYYIIFSFSANSDKDVELYFCPGSLELNLAYYRADSIPIGEWIRLGYIESKEDAESILEKESIPLITGMDGYFILFVTAHGLNAGERTNSFDLKIYNGKTSGTNLLARYEGIDNTLVNRPFSNTIAPGIIEFTILELSTISQLSFELNWHGFELPTTTVDILAAADIRQIQSFTNHYQSTYGMDNFGRKAYSDADKVTEGYAKYTQYSSSRYTLRKVYSEQLKAIAMAGVGNYDSALETAKVKLSDAAAGNGCNAVVWLFLSQNGTIRRPIIVAMPNDKSYSASDAMEAALEAEWPGNWTYTYTLSQFGAFVTDISAGKETDTGCITYSTGYNSYGFWYINSKFSDWGVSNYNVQDGDFMSWGDFDQYFYWNWAILRWKLGDAKIAQVLQEKKGITYESNEFFALGADGLAALFPASEFPTVDWCTRGDGQFSRYGQFRELGPEEETIRLINAIGDVSPRSGEAIEAARAAYDELCEEYGEAYAEQRVTNLDMLLAAEMAYAELTRITATANTVRTALMNSLNADPTNINVRSVDGEWKILALARDITDGKLTITDADEIAKNYLFLLDKALARHDGTVESLTDYERVTLALSALGIDATQFKYSESSETYDLTEPFAEYKPNMLLNQTAYALLALNARPYTEDTGAFVAALVDAALDGGGWNLSGVGSPDVDITAIVIQALAPYYQTNSELKDAIDLGLKALQDMQDPISGGFYGMGQYNSCSVAQVVVALCSLGINPTDWTVNGKYNPITALCQFYIADSEDATKGMIKYTLNASAGDQMSTEQAAYALAAYNRLLNGEDTLYDMSNAENNAAALTTLKAALEKLDWTLAQEDAENETDAKTAAEAILTDNLSIGVTAALTVTDFEAAIKGDKDNENGTNGWYSATITLSKGGESTKATESVTITKAEIAATKWYPNENEKALAELKTALEGMAWTLDQVDAEDAGAVKIAVEAMLTAELLNGATATVSITKFEPAAEGTEDNKDGEPGSYTAEIALSKGTGELLAELTVEVTGKITAKAYVAPSDLVEVTFRLIGAYPADRDVDLSKDSYMPEYVTWIETKTYTVNKKDTMSKLLVQALQDAGLESSGADGEYVSTIYAPDVLTGYELSEFTNGERSGWMYTVNGKHVSGIKTYVFQDDPSVMENNKAEVIFHYVNDYLYEVSDWGTGSLGTPDKQNLWLKAPNVEPSAVPASKITLDKSSVSIAEGETLTLTATVSPSYALVTWSSSDKSVATVDASGKVTAVSAGNATITVASVAGEKFASCEVTVTAAEAPEVDIEFIGGTEEKPIAEVTSSVETIVNSDGKESLTATLTIKAKTTDSDGEVVDADPCVVVVKVGSEYKRLEAVQNKKTGDYDFVMDGYTDDMEFVVMLLGDADGDGELTGQDVTVCKSVFLGKESFEGLGAITADLDGNGFNGNDVTSIKSAFLGKEKLEW